ncbi:transglycosylase SLT domain-containing protein [Fulvivirgaceae bacterium LMO-SS25]
MRNKRIFYNIIGAISLMLMATSVSFSQENLNISNSEVLEEDLYTSPLMFDYIPDASYEEIEQRLAAIPSSLDLEMNDRIKIFVDYFTVREREYTRMVARKMNVYFPLFEKYLAKHNMPDELKYLAIVESGLNPRARSRAGAVGLWQFMPATGRSFKLNQTWYSDDRMDPESATEAACLYLKQLYGIFGDWHLALASYNAGPGNVRKAINRSGGKRTFWGIYDHLPRETRSYVPQMVAIIYTMNHLEEHNLMPNNMEYAMDYEAIEVNQFVNLEKFSDASGICMEDLELLNPSLIRGAVPENAKNFRLKIPAHYAHSIEGDFDNIMAMAATGKEDLEKLATNAPGSTYGREKVTYSVRSGDVLGKIAQRYNVSVADLREWNMLNGNLIRVGQRMNIWVPASSASSKVAEVITQNGQKLYQVQPGDTLWDISIKHQISIDELRKRNNLNGNKIKPGQKLVIG